MSFAHLRALEIISPRFLPAGESALVVEYGASADPKFHDQVLVLDAALQAQLIEGVLETVPTYRSLMIRFDPRRLTTESLQRALASVVETKVAAQKPRRWDVPACYEPPHAEDLDELANELGLHPERVAELHAGARYKVVMYGFAPGFVFLSGLPKELHISRRAKPRDAAIPGALTIANGQALIASIAMPTGWYVLGRTPVRTFDPNRDPAFPIGIGDEVSFSRIDATAFEHLSRAAEAGKSILKAS